MLVFVSFPKIHVDDVASEKAIQFFAGGVDIFADGFSIFGKS